MTTKILHTMEKPELIECVQNLEFRLGDLESELDYNRSVIETLKRQIYGKKSERFVEENSDQLNLFNEDDTNNNNGKDTDKNKDVLEEIHYERKKRGAKQPKDLSHLPHREEILRVEESERHCPCCNKERPFIGYKETKYINHIPAVIELLVQKQEVFGKCCEECEPAVVAANLPNRILPGTMVTEETLAFICVSKVIDRMPLYHLERQLDLRYGCPISRQTLARWLIQLGVMLQPLVTLIKETIWDYDVMWLDATWFQVLEEDGKKPETKSYAYCGMGGPPGKQGVFFEYTPNHTDFLKEFLLDWKGYLHCDAANCYHYLKESDDIQLVFCNAHARRKFEEIVKSHSKAPVAKEMMRRYNQIYKLERQAKKEQLSPELLQEFRQKHIKPIMDELKALVDTKLPLTSQSTRLHKALSYLNNHWLCLNEFLNDGRTEFDNNRVERLIKYFALARNNFLFADSVGGAESLAVHFSLLVSAQQNKLEPLKYYTKVLKSIPNCRSNHWEDYEALLPWNIQLD